MVILSEEVTLLLFVSLLRRGKGSTHKGKNLLLEEQILSFMGRPHFKELTHTEKQMGSHTRYYKEA